MSPRVLFDRELDALREDVRAMGERIDQNYDKLFQTLRAKDRETMGQITGCDRSVNDMQRNIEAKCLTLFTRQQPVAGDLRTVSAALKAVTDMERVGDHVADMAELFLRMGLTAPEEFSACLPKMAETAGRMVREAVEAFVERNPEKAAWVVDCDDVVDDFFNQVKSDLIKDLKSGVKDADDCVDMLMIAKYLEKIGDHAVNIAEWEIFRETGNMGDRRLL